LKTPLIRYLQEEYKDNPITELNLSTPNHLLLDYDSLTLILNIVGQSLTVLKLPDYAGSVDSTTIGLIIDLCPVLQSLDLARTKFDPKAVKTLRRSKVKQLTVAKTKDKETIRHKGSKIGIQITFVKTEAKAMYPQEDEKDDFGRLLFVMEQQFKKGNFSMAFDVKKEWEDLIDTKIQQLETPALLEGIMEVSSFERQSRLVAYSLRDGLGKSENDVTIFLQLLDDLSERVRVWAVICLGQIGSTHAIRPLMAKSKREQSERVRLVMNATIARYTAGRAGILVTRNDRTKFL